MGVTVDEVKGIRRVSLSGRLDADGLEVVEDDFAAAVAEGPDVIVDLSEVPFLASLGIRMLVTASGRGPNRSRISSWISSISSSVLETEIFR